METAQLTGCSNCMKIFIDMNPANQPEFPSPNGVEELPTIEFSGEDDPEDKGYVGYGCDECGTDGNLMDIKTQEQYEMFVDMFDNHHLLPVEVQDILEKHGDSNDGKALKQKLETVGYTCDYDLDGTCTGLKKLQI